MIVGDPSSFAIESGITQAFQRLSFRALGFFVIYVIGRRYGVQSPDATMLACSFDEVKDRIARRNKHIAPFATEPGAADIADAFRCAIYAPNQEAKSFFGFPQPAFCDLIYSHHLLWAPDGDEAFDDGSYVIQFDVADRVRLIAFRSRKDSYAHDPSTLTDAWLGADDFYGILEQWRAAFEVEWETRQKVPEDKS